MPQMSPLNWWKILISNSIMIMNIYLKTKIKKNNFLLKEKKIKFYLNKW